MDGVLCGAESNEGKAFDLEQFVNAHEERLLRAAYRLCRDRSEAEDLVQEALLQAVKSSSHFRGASARYTWIHGILLNVCRRHRRKQQRLVYDDVLVLSQPSGPDASFSLDHSFLPTAMDRLSREHREALVLRYYENLKVEEIARNTGVSAGTVKSRLHYAIRTLRKHYFATAVAVACATAMILHQPAQQNDCAIHLSTKTLSPVFHVENNMVVDAAVPVETTIDAVHSN